MTPRLAAALALVALLAAILWRGASGSAPSAPSPTKPAASGPAPPRGPSPEPKHLARDPFRYADSRPVPHDSALQPLQPVPTPLATLRPAEPPVRLSGFARRSGVLKAVLNLLGSVAVVGPGETIEGYQVLSVDEERGVRLLQPDGTEIRLSRSDS